MAPGGRGRGGRAEGADLPRPEQRPFADRGEPVSDPAIDRLAERAHREYYENKAAEAKRARKRACEAEAAKWEPKPSPLTHQG